MCIQGKFLECLQDNTEGTVMANRKWSSEWRQEGGCRDTQPRFTREMKESHSGLQQESLGSHQALTLAGMRARSQGKDAEDRGRMDFKLWSRKKNKRMKEREQYAHFKKKSPNMSASKPSLTPTQTLSSEVILSEDLSYWLSWKNTDPFSFQDPSMLVWCKNRQTKQDEYLNAHFMGSPYMNIWKKCPIASRYFHAVY